MGWPPFVAEWPLADMKPEGLVGRVLSGDEGWVVFMVAERDVHVPLHRHGAQWGIVLHGEMELRIADETRVYRSGDAHFIPAGVDHEATIRAGWQGVYVFERAPGALDDGNRNPGDRGPKLRS